jgi:hypothetical protein
LRFERNVAVAVSLAVRLHAPNQLFVRAGGEKKEATADERQ